MHTLARFSHSSQLFFYFHQSNDIRTIYTRAHTQIAITQAHAHISAVFSFFSN